MIRTNWEQGATCPACHQEVALGEETLYGKHLACARGRAEGRDNGADFQAAYIAACGQLAVPGHISLTRRQLRLLLDRAVAGGLSPVHRPDRGRGGPWYSRMAGWADERVRAGLDAGHVAGLWLDFLSVGRMPPLRHDDLNLILAAAEEPAGAGKT